jgi:hypothetical protein
MLLAMGAGWLAARQRWIDAPVVVKVLNELVLRLCLPSMQLWLLAISTDLRDWESWRWAALQRGRRRTPAAPPAPLPPPFPRLAAAAKPPTPEPSRCRPHHPAPPRRILSIYMMWSLAVQAGCAAWVLHQGGDLRAMGMHMLVLTANNTGIIGVPARPKPARPPLPLLRCRRRPAAAPGLAACI